MSLDLLTIRRLPVLSSKEPASDYRMRISKTLVRFCQQSLQKQYPGIRVGKRFSVEYILQKYLFDEGFISTDPSAPRGALPELLVKEEQDDAQR